MIFPKPAKIAIISAVAIGGTLLGLVWALQDKLIYFPQYPNKLPSENPQGYRNPGEINLPYEDVQMTTSDGVNIHGWFIKKQAPALFPTIVMFHGNAGNIGHRLPIVEKFYQHCSANIFIVGYRGYSFSEGKPSEKGLQKDSLATLDYIFSRTDIDTNRIFLMGSSLGGAVSVYAATQRQHPLAGVILENTFTSMGDMVDQVFPSLKRLKWIALANHWETINRIGKVKVPILFISGLKDELVPPEQMQRLYQAAVGSAFRDKLGIEDGTHNDTWYQGGMRYFKAICEFMAKAEKLTRGLPKAHI